MGSRSTAAVRRGRSLVCQNHALEPRGRLHVCYRCRRRTRSSASGGRSSTRGAGDGCGSGGGGGRSLGNRLERDGGPLADLQLFFLQGGGGGMDNFEGRGGGWGVGGGGGEERGHSEEEGGTRRATAAVPIGPEDNFTRALCVGSPRRGKELTRVIARSSSCNRRPFYHKLQKPRREKKRESACVEITGPAITPRRECTSSVTTTSPDEIYLIFAPLLKEVHV